MDRRTSVKRRAAMAAVGRLDGHFGVRVSCQNGQVEAISSPCWKSPNEPNWYHWPVHRPLQTSFLVGGEA